MEMRTTAMVYAKGKKTIHNAVAPYKKMARSPVSTTIFPRMVANRRARAAQDRNFSLVAQH